MDTSHWLDTWGDHILRQYLVDMVRAFSRDPEAQEDLLTTAWLTIGDCECGCTTEHLMDVGFYAIMHRFRTYHWRPVRKWHEDPARRRVQRRRKKYFIIVTRHPMLM